MKKTAIFTITKCGFLYNLKAKTHGKYDCKGMTQIELLNEMDYLTNAYKELLGIAILFEIEQSNRKDKKMLGKIKLYDIDTALSIDEQVRKHDPYTDPDVDIELYGLPFELFDDVLYNVIKINSNCLEIYDDETEQIWSIPYYLVKRFYLEEQK